MPEHAAFHSSIPLGRLFPSPGKIGLLFCCLAILLALLASPQDSSAASGGKTGSELEKQIAQEQARAKTRRESLLRMTAEERRLDKDLGALENDILQIEDSLSRAEKRLEDLAASDAALQGKEETLRSLQAKTEEAMSQVLCTLWEIHSRREGVKGRDLPDWPETDREHVWSTELFGVLDKQRATLAAQQKEIDEVKAGRAKIAAEVRSQVDSFNEKKQNLLGARVQYGQKLADLRQQKQSTEKELTDILALVRNLNFRLQSQESQESEQDIAKAKGKLPWPVIGKLESRFRASAQPPVRGITLSLDQDTAVHAVHRGKVVHNDVLRGIGRVVILLHGDEYYSLYAFLSESPLRIGQEVKQGEVVGTSGFVTSLNGPGLYFELRFHQKAINPEEWLRKR